MRLGVAYRTRDTNLVGYRAYQGIRLTATTTYGF